MRYRQFLIVTDLSAFRANVFPRVMYYIPGNLFRQERSKLPNKYPPLMITMPEPPTYGFPKSSFDPTTLPDFDTEFIDKADIEEFAKALNAPETSTVVALNDWRPVHQRVKRKRPKPRKKPRRTTDETREGFVYGILKWPLLLIVAGWILFLTSSYLLTRLYIYGYEHMVTWRGQRQRLRHNLRSKTNYQDWRIAAQELDDHLGNEQWKLTDDYAYYDHNTVTKVKEQLKAGRALAKSQEQIKGSSSGEAVHKLRNLVEACVKNNFVGVENSSLYSETYYGTKRLAQEFIDELHSSLQYLLQSSQLSQPDKYSLAKHLHSNFGRTAFCLSGGASFAWYVHSGVNSSCLSADWGRTPRFGSRKLFYSSTIVLLSRVTAQK